jgi:hypothetical protein
MKGFAFALGAGFFCALPLGAQPRQPAQFSVIPDPQKAGQDLATKLRAVVPPRDAEFTGKLVIVTEGGRVSEVPIGSRVIPGATNWHVIYQTFDPSGGPREILRIRHAADLPNVYFFTPDAGQSSPKAISVSELSHPFGGSDFWLMDLGLDFLHWPGQRLLRNEMRRSRACYVLESSRPDAPPGQYERVVSWVDTEILQHDGVGLIRAEAFDGSHKLMKEFNVGKFRKIDGQWQLQDMKITSERTGQETELKFDLKKQQ